MIDIKPDFYEAYYNIGVSNFLSWRFEKSIESYLKAVEIFPNRYESWYNLGTSYFRARKYDKAIESYKKCIEKTLQMTNLRAEDVDLHIPCNFGQILPDIKNIVNVKEIANSQNIVGTLESATAILNTIAGILALENGFAPKYDVQSKLYERDFKNILISGAAFNGVYYSFILKKSDVHI